MDIQEKIAILEEIMELEKNVINENSKLNEIEEWNSLAKLSLIALMDEKYGKQISAQQIKEFVYVKDIIKLMD